MTDMRDEFRDDPRHHNLSTADLAAAAERGAGESTADLERRLDDRELARRRETEGPADMAAGRYAPLLPAELVDDFHARWNEIQAGFVDEPRLAVEQADGLVAEAIKRLAESFARERGQLEGQWDRGGDVSTEDLRQALQRYRSFFARLLSV